MPRVVLGPGPGGLALAAQSCPGAGVTGVERRPSRSLSRTPWGTLQPQPSTPAPSSSPSPSPSPPSLHHPLAPSP